MFCILFLGILCLTLVNAHGRVGGVVAEGKYYVGADHYSNAASAGWRSNNGDNGFATSITSEDIICHNQATAGSEYITIAAGQSIELQWTTWPESHKGPMLDYLAPCGADCATVNKAQLQFTKIAEAGLLDASTNPQRWASDDLISNNFTWVTTIPSDIAPGKYVLRHEAIALHSAGNVGGVQAYPQCFNLEVTGAGTNSLANGTPGTKLYGDSDPGILVNIYYPVLASYSIPGPPLTVEGKDDNSGTPSNVGNSPLPTEPVPTKSASPASDTEPAIISASPTSDVIVPRPDHSSTVIASVGARKFICYEEL